MKIGEQVTVEGFEPGQMVKVSGRSKGKGFQGTIRRHGFHRGPGQPRLAQRPRAGLDRRQRHSRRACFKGSGCRARWATGASPSAACEVVEVDAERNLLIVRGAVPGPEGAIVEVRSE